MLFDFAFHAYPEFWMEVAEFAKSALVSLPAPMHNRTLCYNFSDMCSIFHVLFIHYRLFTFFYVIQFVLVSNQKLKIIDFCQCSGRSHV